MTDKKIKYFLEIDGLRILAILAVICIHTTTRVLEITNLNILSEYVAFFLNQISRFAVPLFFLISGFVLELSGSGDESYFSYLKKRLSRIFLPYVFWSIIYYLFVYTQHSNSIFQAILTGSASYQLYFIPTLLIFYLVFPFLHKIYGVISNRYVLMILGIIQLIILGSDYYFQAITLYYALAIAVLNFYVFILGMVASRNIDKISLFVGKWKNQLLVFLLIASLYVVVEGGINYLKTWNYLAFYSQWRPSVMIYSIIFFGVFFVYLKKLYKYEGLTKLMSGLSFFIFFVHVMVLEFVWKMVGRDIYMATSNMAGQQFWFVPGFTLGVMIISYLIAHLVHKIPLMTRISG